MPEKKNWFARHKILTAIGIILLIGIIAGAAGGDNTPAPSSDTEQSTQDSTEPTQTSEPKEEEKKVSLDDFYTQVENGQSKDEVKALAGGREPSSCYESVDEFVGKTEYCSYGGFMEGGMVSVVYTNDTVSSKSKNDF